MAGMSRYYSTFVPGFGEVVSDQLKKDLSGVEIDLLLDGLVVYSTTEVPSAIKNLRYFNNSFFVLHFFKKIQPNSLPGMVKFVYQSDFLKKMELPPLKNVRTFRVITSRQNELGSIDLNLLANVEKQIAKGTQFQTDRANPDVEFWFLERSEGMGFFALRLTTGKVSPKTLKPGELRPELAHLLILLSEPKEGNVFLDPFAGWGGIVKEAARFPFKEILASDIDKEKVSVILNVVKDLKTGDSSASLQNGVVVQQADATKLEHTEDASVDKIVTDPPWGLADQLETENIEDLYERAFKKFARILKPDGIIVLLTSRKLTMEKLLLQNADFKLVSKYDVLVNGKKAGVYKSLRQENTPEVVADCGSLGWWACKESG